MTLQQLRNAIRYMTEETSYSGKHYHTIVQSLQQSLSRAENLPLTRNDLLSMIGCPVYHQVFGNVEASGWIIADEEYCNMSDCWGGNEYGSSFVAYRHKPTKKD